MQPHEPQIWQPLPVDEFAALGIHNVAYVKPRPQENGRIRYAIHAADGSEVAIVARRDQAFATIRQNDLEPVSVH